LLDRPSQPWSEFTITDNYSEENENKEDKKIKKGGKSKRLIKRKNKTKKMK